MKPVQKTSPSREGDRRIGGVIIDSLMMIPVFVFFISLWALIWLATMGYWMYCKICRRTFDGDRMFYYFFPDDHEA